MKNSPLRSRLMMIVMMITLLLSLILGGGLAGCEKKANSVDEETANHAQDQEQAGEADAPGPIAPAMFDQMKQMMVQQATLPVAQADTLRQALVEHPDDQLRQILVELDAKNASIKAMLDRITSPADSKALQVDVPQAIGEAGELAAKANQRLQEVLKAKFGGGGG
jgi:hypothetical protein